MPGNKSVNSNSRTHGSRVLAKHIPNFVFDCVAALVARRFLLSNITLTQMASFYAEVLSEHYQVEDLASELENCAEDFLRTLNEIGAENADEILKSFERIRITTTDNTSPRKLKSMFSSALDGLPQKEHSVESTIKRFKAFIFLVRSKPSYYAPGDWNWSKVTDSNWLGDIEDVEIDPFSFL